MAGIVCVCVCVCAFHGAWLNQLEQGIFTRDDVDAKLRFKRALVWHAPPPTAAAGNALSSG